MYNKWLSEKNNTTISAPAVNYTTACKADVVITTSAPDIEYCISGQTVVLCNHTKGNLKKTNQRKGSNHYEKRKEWKENSKDRSCSIRSSNDSNNST